MNPVSCCGPPPGGSCHLADNGFAGSQSALGTVVESRRNFRSGNDKFLSIRLRKPKRFDDIDSIKASVLYMAYIPVL